MDRWTVPHLFRTLAYYRQRTVPLFQKPVCTVAGPHEPDVVLIVRASSIDGGNPPPRRGQRATLIFS
jgi:hypothetical protein